METLDRNRKYTFDEYLEFERNSPIKHEYHNGHIIPVNEIGFSPKDKDYDLIHHQILDNTSLVLSRCLLNSDYTICNSSFKIRLEAIDNSTKGRFSSSMQ